MARTTTLAVKDILLQDYACVTEPSLGGYIASASAIVSRVIECAASKGITISSLEAELLERWVAAHLYVQSDATYSERQTLRASGKFNKTWDSYLKVAYGLDPSGCLLAAFTNKRVRAFWMGKPKCSQIPYVDRN